MSMNFAELLTKYRERADITKTTLSQKVEVSIGYIINLESGIRKPPRYDLCVKIADALGLTRNERLRFLGRAFYERANDDDRNFIHELTSGTNQLSSIIKNVKQE